MSKSVSEWLAAVLLPLFFTIAWAQLTIGACCPAKQANYCNRLMINCPLLNRIAVAVPFCCCRSYSLKALLFIILQLTIFHHIIDAKFLSTDNWVTFSFTLPFSTIQKFFVTYRHWKGYCECDSDKRCSISLLHAFSFCSLFFFQNFL